MCVFASKRRHPLWINLKNQQLFYSRQEKFLILEIELSTVNFPEKISSKVLFAWNKGFLNLLSQIRNNFYIDITYMLTFKTLVHSTPKFLSLLLIYVLEKILNLQIRINNNNGEDLIQTN